MARTSNIGDFDRRVSVREWSDAPTPDFGTSQQFATVQQVWARKRPVGPGLFYGTQQIEGGVTHQYFFRRTALLNERTITQLHVVEDAGERFRVKRAQNVEEARELIQLDVELLGLIA